MNVEKFFSKDQKAQIVNAIKEAENETSGEIRVHLESSCKSDVLERTITIFEKLKMHETQLRNGSLIYLAVQDKKFAIFGDEGINEVVPDDFWQDIRDIMQKEFSSGNFSAGLIQGINLIGQKLKEFFPVQQNDVNELSDDLSMGE
jgi:uncharacterized membrane protein